MIRAVLDVQSVTPQRSGIGEFARQVALNLVRHFPDRIALSFYDGTTISRVSSEEDCEAVWRTMPEGSMYAAGNQFRLPFLLTSKTFDIFLSPDFIIPYLNGRVPMIAIIHDLIPLIITESVRDTRKAKMIPLYRALCRLTLARCARVLTVSECSKLDIISLLHGDEHLIDVVYNGVNFFDNPVAPVGEAMLRFRPNRYFLYVGRSDVYKGIDKLIFAFEQFRANHSQQFSLVLAGAVSDRHKEYYDGILRNCRFSSDIIQAGYVPDAELAWLYQNATALVLPSLYEGFGVPPVQAMAYGTPAVCSNRASLPEITGGAALLIDPENPHDISDALARIATDSDLRRSLVEKGKTRSRIFQWKNTAELVMRSLEAAVGA